MNVEVVPIAETHAEGFHACLDAVAREKKYLAQIEALPRESIKEFVRENVATGAAHFVAIDGSMVVGWCDILPAWAHANRHCGSLGVGLLPAYRGQGVGRRLLAACLAKAKQNGITRVELEVRADNQHAIGLYERMGFVREATKRNGMRFDGHYFDSIQMSLLFEDEP
ncbi:GNAT family N-acetyltransferase [Roseateles sp. L2-2]|uniref:GNAT family N-acetyltransferase n=1 Tax=Roseateles TaxID=93681 RepID=UPI003D363A2C